MEGAFQELIGLVNEDLVMKVEQGDSRSIPMPKWDEALIQQILVVLAEFGSVLL